MKLSGAPTCAHGAPAARAVDVTALWVARHCIESRQDSLQMHEASGGYLFTVAARGSVRTAYSLSSMRCNQLCYTQCTRDKTSAIHT
jgi:hypothetical protein